VTGGQLVAAHVSIRQHTSAYTPHTSAYVSIRQHTSAYVRSVTGGGVNLPCGGSLRHLARCHHMRHQAFVAEAAELVAYDQHPSALVSIRQHTSAYVSIRQHTSAYVSIRQHTSAASAPREAGRQHTSAYVSIRSICQHTQRMRQAQVT
jgi:hypothetical protein